jgi:PleD family two-component response regulator
MLEAPLQKWGSYVVAAADGLDALRICDRDDSPPLAILDSVMPGCDGRNSASVCARIPIGSTRTFPANSAQSRERRHATRAALQEVSVAGIRPYDTVGRYGGEKFVIVAPWCECSSAALLTETMLTSLRSLRIETDRGPLSVTPRCGIAVSDAAKPIEPQDLLHMADEAFNRAKEHGHNRSEFAEGGPITRST